jgi:hypothetical protein
MPDEEQPRSYLEIIGRLLPEATGFYTGRQISNLISMVAFIDGAIVRIISAYFAADKARASYLADNVVDRMPFDRKLKTLEYVLKQNAWKDEFPELISQLRPLFTLRDELAHSFLDEDVREDGRDFVFTRYSWRDGDYKEVTVRLSDVAEAIRRAQAPVLEDLMAIASRVEPQE